MTIVDQLYVPLLKRPADGFIVAAFFCYSGNVQRIFVFLSRPDWTTKHLFAKRVEWGLGNKNGWLRHAYTFSVRFHISDYLSGCWKCLFDWFWLVDLIGKAVKTLGIVVSSDMVTYTPVTTSLSSFGWWAVLYLVFSYISWVIYQFFYSLVQGGYYCYLTGRHQDKSNIILPRPVIVPNTTETHSKTK